MEETRRAIKAWGEAWREFRLLVGESLIGWAVRVLPNPQAVELSRFVLGSWMARSLKAGWIPSEKEE